MRPAAPSSARSVVVALLVVFALARLAFGQAGEALTNEDIVKMVRAQLSVRLVLSTIDDAKFVKFDVSPAALIALKDAKVDDQIIEAMQTKARAQGERERAALAAVSPPGEPERSDPIASKDPETILRSFKTMFVDARQATWFNSDQMKAALGKDKGFKELKITIVDDAAVADTVLSVGYTFAWDYPFSLTHQNTRVVLVSGKGAGPFSPPAGASSVAKELTKLLRPYRVPAAEPTKK